MESMCEQMTRRCELRKVRTREGAKNRGSERVGLSPDVQEVKGTNERGYYSSTTRRQGVLYSEEGIHALSWSR